MASATADRRMGACETSPPPVTPGAQPDRPPATERASSRRTIGPRLVGVKLVRPRPVPPSPGSGRSSLTPPTPAARTGNYEEARTHRAPRRHTPPSRTIKHACLTGPALMGGVLCIWSGVRWIGGTRIAHVVLTDLDLPTASDGRADTASPQVTPTVAGRGEPCSRAERWWGDGPSGAAARVSERGRGCPRA